MNPKLFFKVYWLPSLLFGVGFILSAVLAFSASSTKPLNGYQSVIVLIVAVISQVAGGRQIYKIGYVDPKLARSEVNKFYRLAVRASEARQLAEESSEGTGQLTEHEALGRLSVHLSWLEEEITASGQIWIEVHSEALAGFRKDEDRGSN
jgi:membrane protein YqaA with SNARE-associated domain